MLVGKERQQVPDRCRGVVGIQRWFVAHEDLRRLGSLGGGARSRVLGGRSVTHSKGADAALLAGGNTGTEGGCRLGAQHNRAVGTGEVVQEQLLHLSHGQHTR